MLPKIKLSKRALKKAVPTILTCAGTVGVVLTAVFTGKAAVKASKKIEEAKTIKMEETGEELTVLETVEECWKDYIPPVAIGIATVGCILSSNILNRRQTASAMAAYAFAMKSLKNYKRAVAEEFGEEGIKRIEERLIVEYPEVPCIYGALTGGSFDFGETDENKHLFYDAFSNRLFTSTYSDVALAELHTNRKFALSGDVSLRTFYDFLGLETPPELEDLYWYVSDEYCFIDFTHTIRFLDDGPDHEPVECQVIHMVFEPQLNPPD